MVNPLIIGITGLPSSGKGVFGEIAKSFGFKEIIMGDVVRNECKLRGLPINRESSNKVMMDLRKERGENAIALITLEWVHQALNKELDKILIDGIRSLSEVATIKMDFPNFILIAIHSDPKTRLSRALARKRIDDAFSEDAFYTRDQIELNLGIGDVIATADVLINSSGSLNESKVMIQDFFEEFCQINELEIELYSNDN